MSKPIIFLTGVHGSGKSTLAERYASENSLTYIPSSVSDIHKKYGVTVAQEIDLDLKLKIQHEVLQTWKGHLLGIFEQGTGAIFDRCPVDFYVYTIMAIRKDSNTKHCAIMQNYLDECIRMMKQVMASFRVHLIYVSPISQDDLLTSDRGVYKAPPGPFAQMFSDIMIGCLYRNELPAQIIEGPLDKRYSHMATLIRDLMT
jgi:adenosyl cobinamide kinase/adenosyl cobinamide phosphate guanylyltransferase